MHAKELEMAPAAHERLRQLAADLESEVSALDGALTDDPQVQIGRGRAAAAARS